MEKHRTLAVNNAQLHGFRVQVDSAIILVLFRVELHSVPLCCVVVTFIIPSGMNKEALISIKSLQLTWHACMFALE